MKKKVKVIMLPTEKATHIENREHPKEWHIWGDGSISYKGYITHLYIISDDEIKESDWYLSCISNIIINDNNLKSIEGDKKVIASTDESLGLPGIPDSFIKKYVEENGKVDEVLIEFTDSIFTCPNCGSNGYTGTFLEGGINCVNCKNKYTEHDKVFPLEPSIRKNNTIEILPNKTYTKKDFLDFIYWYRGTCFNVEGHSEEEVFEEWLKGND
jgi:hypothetical protein